MHFKQIDRLKLPSICHWLDGYVLTGRAYKSPVQEKIGETLNTFIHLVHETLKTVSRAGTFKPPNNQLTSSCFCCFEDFLQTSKASATVLNSSLLIAQSPSSNMMFSTLLSNSGPLQSMTLSLYDCIEPVREVTSASRNSVNNWKVSYNQQIYDYQMPKTFSHIIRFQIKTDKIPVSSFAGSFWSPLGHMLISSLPRSLPVYSRLPEG